MDGRHVRIGHVGDEADAGGEEMRVLASAVDRAGEFLGEAAGDRGDVDSDFLEHRAAHQPTDASAARAAIGVGAVPRRVDEARVAAGLALDLLEGGADAVAQALEPDPRLLLLFVELDHRGHKWVCLSASASPMPAATARFKERVPAACGIRTRSAAAA